MAQRHIVRDISYAPSARSRSGRAVIRVLENATGRLSLIRRAEGYEREIADGRSFWDVIVERYGLSLEVVGGSLNHIPANGPLVVIANHPYGILDGLMMGHLLDRVRGDFRILANSVFRRAEELNKVVLPISFDDTKEAVKLNIATRAACLSYLGQGGAIGVFPGGTVSTSRKIFSRPMDPGWRNFTAKMIAKSNATVVPLAPALHAAPRPADQGIPLAHRRAGAHRRRPAAALGRSGRPACRPQGDDGLSAPRHL